MASGNKDEQFIFEFNEVDGPEKPALEPEDDSLLDLDGAAAPEEDDETWEPQAPVAVAIEVAVVAEEAKAEAQATIAAQEPVQAAQPAPVQEPAPAPAPVVEEAPAEAKAPVAAEKPAEEAPALQAAAAVKEEAKPAKAEAVQEEPVIAEAPEGEAKSKALKPADIRRAALAWMAKQKPTALAAKVPTRLKRFCASVAAFWSEPGRRKRLLKPQRTAIVEIRADREACFAESAKNAELLPALRDAKARKTELEAEIRLNEPNLKDGDYLFDEIENWNYAASKNKDYRQALKRIEELERAIHNGSRFEKIRRAKVSNELYLAVPEGAVHPDELAEGWGLIYVSPELDAKLIKKAEAWDCPEDNMMHLAQNIGASALRDVLFSNGVHLAADGSISLIKPPRRRRPAK